MTINNIAQDESLSGGRVGGEAKFWKRLQWSAMCGLFQRDTDRTGP